MDRHSDDKKLRYVYIIEVDNLGSKSKFYGLRKIFYTGQTDNIRRRFQEHLGKYNSKFLTNNFKDARRIMVYIEYVFGTEYDAMIRENKIKKMERSKKMELITSESNSLIKYKVTECGRKLFIMKLYNAEGQEVIYI